MNTICLVDAENFSYRKVGACLDHIRKQGNLVEVRVYGDFSRVAMKGWKDHATRHGMTQVHRPATVKGKNTSDISLAIDAVDLIYLRKTDFDNVALITSDSDFSVLVNRFKQDDIFVDGYGEIKAPMVFKDACRNYYDHDLVVNDLSRPISVSGKFVKLLKLLRRSVQRNSNIAGWAKVSTVNKDIRAINPSVRCENYGVRNFVDLFEHEQLQSLFDIRKIGDNLEVKIS